MSKVLLAIDQGTTSTRAIVFSMSGYILGVGQQEFKQHFPKHGWVEHDPNEIWEETLKVCRQALRIAEASVEDVEAIGITNQRETVVLWDRRTGQPLHNAIVWQDRRTANTCAQLKSDGAEALVQSKTGLLLDPYFSGTKLKWMLDNVPNARERAAKGELAFGTIDSYLLWKLTGGRSHKTDASNASRTLLFNIHTNQWDPELLDLLGIPSELLPEVMDNAAPFGECDTKWFGRPIPITGMAGDQHAALFGQACFEPGMIKSTYGTGCFLMMNTGDQVIESKNRLLSTVGYRLSGQTTYAVEGSIFVAGAAMKWCRDQMHLFKDAKESETMAKEVGVDHGVYLVPSFVGLGAPYWEAEAKGAIVGLGLDSDRETVVTAALQSIAYQTHDLVQAIKKDGADELAKIRVDGGMVVNNWAMQFLADMTQLHVDRPKIIETTAWGAAALAALGAGVFNSLDDIRDVWALERSFEPKLPMEKVDELLAGWAKAVRQVLAE